jgi:YHS domain-containing protein
MEVLMKSLVVILMTLLSVISWSSTANLNKSGVILDGYDPVSYFKSNKPIKGQSQFQAKHGEAIYWFSNEENKQTFLKDPKKYEPQFGGWCAYAVADSKSKVEVDPQSFLIQDGRLLLFYNGIWSDTRKKWKNSKDKDAKTFLKEADANWPLTQTKDP